MENTLFETMNHQLWNIVNIEMDTVSSPSPKPPTDFGRVHAEQQ